MPLRIRLIISTTSDIHSQKHRACSSAVMRPLKKLALSPAWLAKRDLDHLPSRNNGLVLDYSTSWLVF